MYIPEDESWSMLDPVHAVHASVALIILASDGGRLQVVMEENHDGPHSGKFVLPNTIVRADQTLEEAARELAYSYDLGDIKLDQSSTFSHLQIDPRSRVMTVGFFGAVPQSRLGFVAASNDVCLIDITRDGDEALLSLGGMSIAIGYLHDGVVSTAINCLREGAEYSLKPFAFVEEEFSLAELRSVHEAIFDKEIVPQWFRKKQLKRVFPGNLMITGTGRRSHDAEGRPAGLYRLAYVDPAERDRAAEATRVAKRQAKEVARRGLV